MQRRPPGRALAELIGDAIAPALAAQGFAGREVVSRWEEIAGARLAPRSRPLRIEWPKKRPGGEGERGEQATLVVLVESAFAIELQHLAPVIMSRLNERLGWPAVGRLAMKQGPVAHHRPALQPAPLDPARAARVEAAAAPVGDERLRQALSRLGQGALRRRSAPET